MNLAPARTRCSPRGGYEEYHPYGSTAWWAGSSGLVSQKRYRFTGMERDDETGLQCHGVRYYAVWLGRWVSADPIGLGDGVNRFGYCHGDPVGGRDSTGGETVWPSDPAAQLNIAKELVRNTFGKSLPVRARGKDPKYVLVASKEEQLVAVRGAIAAEAERMTTTQREEYAEAHHFPKEFVNVPSLDGGASRSYNRVPPDMLESNFASAYVQKEFPLGLSTPYVVGYYRAQSDTMFITMTTAVPGYPGDKPLSLQTDVLATLVHEYIHSLASAGWRQGIAAFGSLNEGVVAYLVDQVTMGKDRAEQTADDPKFVIQGADGTSRPVNFIEGGYSNDRAAIERILRDKDSGVTENTLLRAYSAGDPEAIRAVVKAWEIDQARVQPHD